MTFPPKVIVAMIVAAMFAALGVFAVAKLPYARDLRITQSQRRGLVAVVAILSALAAASVVYVLPVYWH